MVDSSDNIDTATNEKNQHAGPFCTYNDTLILAMGPRNLVYLANVIFGCYTRTY